MDAVVDSAKLLFNEFLPYWRRAEGALAVVGFCYAGSVAISLLWQVTNGVRVHFWSRLWKKDLVGKYGKWAVVTGSTDGIGKSYAKELASKGMNVLLVSRTKAKLERVAQEISSKYGVETDIVQADFSEGRSVYGNIAEHLKGKDIGILVNNVGMLVTPRLFLDIPEDDIWAYASVNVASVPAMDSAHTSKPCKPSWILHIPTYPHTQRISTTYATYIPYFLHLPTKTGSGLSALSR
ncbi:hypothetical protein C7M84_002736 [Penaeus vannamei]|uniref:Inactive hydroxysteroid dehydrogenase-like protein 1 n=1 Tax=Penaeus vannamei TaxID=6689 RepID=A0A3R7P8K1_PENVA|nr:hypothetical protein C7M84_002736 [Penaeus vannamei]